MARPAAGKGALPGGSGAAPGAVRLLSGDNPQIPKGDGDAPVEAWLAAIPGWKSPLARELDALIVRTVPGVEKAMRWNTPLYGLPGAGWFLGVHGFTRYLKITFFRGAGLEPLPPEGSKDPQTRYLHLYEAGITEREQLASWIRQAAALPGWKPGTK